MISLQKKYRLLLGVCIILLALPVKFALADTDEERLLKAAFVFNFAKFTRWPEGVWNEAGSELRLCTYGQNSLINELGKLDGRTVKERSVKVIPLIRLEQGSQCHLLYVEKTEMRSFTAAYSLLKDEAILTVSDMSGFSRMGGMIELYRDNGQIRFIINIARVREAGLDLSSRLLSLATVIEHMEMP